MILDNPFHVLGLAADSGAAVRSQREGQVKAYLRMGKSLVFTDDLYFEGCRRNQGTVERALAQLVDARDRIGYGLFWFTAGDPKDVDGFRFLHRGDLHGACDYWSQRLKGGRFGRGTISTHNNHGTVRLLIGMRRDRATSPTTAADRKRHIRRGLEVKVKLIGDLSEEELRRFCATFSDEMATRDTGVIVEAFGESLERFQEEADKYGVKLSSGEIADILDAGGERTSQLKKRFAHTSQNELERAISECRTAYMEDRARAGAAARKLVRVAQEHLPKVKAMMGSGDIAYQSEADRVARALLDANIAWYNQHSGRSNALAVLDESVIILQYVLEIAQGGQLRQKASEGLKIMRASRSQVRMSAVLTPMRSWIESAGEAVGASKTPSWRVAFVKRSLKATGADSAMGLLGAIRQRGTAVVGSDYARQEEMVAIASIVCSILVSHAIVAYNDSRGVHEAWSALELLPMIGSHFGMTSTDSGMASASITYNLNAESLEYLTRNLALAESQGRSVSAARRAQSVPARPDSGCLGVVVTPFGWLALIALVVVGVVVAFDGDDPGGGALTFSMPSVGGSERTLSMAELRWCLREQIRVDAAKKRVGGSGRVLDQRRVRLDRTSQADVDQFNAAIESHNAANRELGREIDFYNARCSEFQYRPGNLETARRQVQEESRRVGR